jgi:NADP-dependent 3-hydroxy acid dehydrogenase YdfG
VIACARTVGGLEELDDAIKTVGGTATLVPFDLADMNAIDALGASINERWGKLDILVANAGMLGVISPIGHIEAKVFEKVMTINVTATWRLIRSVEPLLVKSDQGRALILSSAAAHKCRPIDPGPTRTAMRAQAVPGEDPSTVPHPSEVAAKLLPLCGPDLTETGKLFVVRENKLVDYRMPE